MWTDLQTYLKELSPEKFIELFRYQPESPMLFSTGLFLFLFLGFYIIYNSLQHKQRARIIYVILFSFYFYYKTSGIWLVLLLFTATSDFFIGRFIAGTNNWLSKKMWVALSVCINLGMLAYFKYTNFFYELAIGFWRQIGGIMDEPLLKGLIYEPLDIFLPIGISFFTFQSLSYTIDVYRGQVKPVNRWTDYLFFVSFFPGLVAGPIVRARDFLPQMFKKPVLSYNQMGEALYLIICGLFKKCIISDYISVNFVDRIFDAPALYTGVENLMGVYGYALQIYCDFSGYSDMAIGIALLLGIRFNINFDSPYQSATITEFWRRWHISLSTWFRDYVYIPLGGSRCSKIINYRNILIVWFLTGFWHGASWNFIVWGLYYCALLVIEKAFLLKFLDKIPVIFQRIYTLFFVVIGWLLFVSESQYLGGLSDGIVYLGNMFGIGTVQGMSQGDIYDITRNFVFFIIMAVAATPLPKKLFYKFYDKSAIVRYAAYAGGIAVLIFAAAYLVDSSFNPFLYFRF